MRLSALRPLLVPLYCGILSVASPGITSNTAGPEMPPEAAVSSDGSLYNYTVANHSLLISGFSTKDIKKDIFIDNVLSLKLECTLVVDSMDLQISVSWRHGKDQISSNLYTYNNTDKQWNTAYEFVVTDVNKTGDYACVFSSGTEVYGTFSVIVPPVHSGSKAVVSYNGDFLVLKCDTSEYKPVKWLWFKVTEDELVPVNFTMDTKRYSELSTKLNETKLRISDLTESDSGGYACKADFGEIGESKGQVEIKVISYMVPLRIFLAIAAEVAILVIIIGVYEFISKRKQGQEDVKQDYEPMSQMKSEDSSIAEASTTRQRKV
ncbi:embigin [Hyla sarda]|uniref:embigin n=1 Tax=Hyla sarda TaxID=327740 RepID=UPI0024C3ABA2|nr:embigin [Hyla sarda]XP_056397976.1 embigin [Hyla sarda]XP_056397981.1 embigin [Hyla sarda]